MKNTKRALNLDIASDLAKVLPKRGSMTSFEIIEHFTRAEAAEFTSEAALDTYRGAIETDLDLPLINRWLRSNGHPTATLARSAYFTKFRGVKPVDEKDARVLVAGLGQGARAAGIVVDEPAIFDASRESTTRRAGAMAEHSRKDLVAAERAGLAKPEHVLSSTQALEKIRDTIDQRGLIHLRDRAHRAHVKL